MGEGNHLSTSSSVDTTGNRNSIVAAGEAPRTNRTTGQPNWRWKWVFGGTTVAVLAAGAMMQYVRGSTTKADSDAPAGTSRVGETKKKPVAKVGDESISHEYLAEECFKRYGREVLDDLIHRMIIQKACEKNQITVTEQEISEEINRIAKRFNLEPDQWLQMLQAERNIAPMQYRQSVIFPMIALKKLASETTEVDEREMKEAFIRNYGPRVKARMIMFDNLRRAQDGHEQVRDNPDDFEQVAAKLSIDPSSRALGGQIPPIPRNNGNEALEKEAFKLKMGQISPVIEVAPGRFIILKCEGRTDPVVTNMDEVRDVIYEELKEQKTQASVAKTFEQIKKETIVDNYLTQTSSRATGGANTRNAVQPVSATKPGSAARTPATASGENSNSSNKPSKR